MAGLYVHIPFCLRRCSYCSFLSSDYCFDMACQFTDALKKEISSLSQEIIFSTIYIGGGTPTVLPPDLLKCILLSLFTNINYIHECEKTIEANPETIDREKLTLIKSFGINRLSIGGQSFNDYELRILGRAHDSEKVYTALKDARRAGFKNINIDLIFGIPGQTLTEWKSTLQKTVSLNPEHISTYGLTIEEGTALSHALKLHTVELPCEDTVADMFELAIDTLTKAGYVHYEISNFSKPGYECKHNLNYWNRGCYYGLGPGAYSFVDERRFFNVKDIVLYNKGVKEGKEQHENEEIIDRNQSLFESIFLGLRKTEGIKIKEINESYHIDFMKHFHHHIDEFCTRGLMTEDSGFLRFTRKGLLVSNEILSCFVDY